MNETKYVVVPEGMLKAASLGLVDSPNGISRTDATLILGAALRWISENPIVPTPEQALAMSVTKPVLDGFDNWELVRWGACEWQRRMFLAPDPDDEIKDMLLSGEAEDSFYSGARVNCKIREAFRRGTLSQNEK